MSSVQCCILIPWKFLRKTQFQYTVRGRADYAPLNFFTIKHHCQIVFCNIKFSNVSLFMYSRGFTKFGIKVLWRLQFLGYLRTLNFKLKVLKYPRNCSFHNTLIPWSLKNPVSPNVHTTRCTQINPNPQMPFLFSFLFLSMQWDAKTG